MDVKLAFFNGNIEEQVYIEQPEWFLLSENKDKCVEIEKALYLLR